MSRLFIRTSLGKDALANSTGVLSGDEKRLMELIDGSMSLVEIKRRVPLSVQRELEKMFTRLLAVEYIAQIDSESTVNSETVSGDDTQPLHVQDDPALKEIERRVELEQEVAALRSELAAMRLRIQNVDVSCNEMRERVTEYTRSMRNKWAGKINSNQYQQNSYSGPELKFLQGLDRLNQSLFEQHQYLEKTLELKAFQPEQWSRDSEPEVARKVRSHPHYGKLRGLDFFKAFGNAELMQFLELAKWLEVKQDETVLHAGELGMPFYIIVTGSVAVFYEKNMLAALEPGDAFGEFSHLSGEFPLRTAQVKAVTPCEFLVVDPLDVEFSSLQIRLHVAEALLRGQVRKMLCANQLLNILSGSSESSL